MPLQSLTQPSLIFPELTATDRSSVLRQLSLKLAEGDFVPDAERLFERLLERESLGSTGIGSGVAVPHCKLKGIDRVLMAVGTTTKPVDFDAVDGEPVRLFFVLLSPHDKPAAHLQSLSAISHWVKAGDHLERLLESRDREEIFELLQLEGEE